MKGKEFAAIIGISPGSLSDIENGNTKPKADTLTALINKTDIDPVWLLTGSEPAAKVKPIPVLGSVPAGFPSDVTGEQVKEYIYVHGSPDNSYALIVDGNSMAPDIRDGEYVLFIPNGEAQAGDVVIVNDEFGRSMVKRLLIKDGLPWVCSDNPEYPDFRVNEHYRLMGRVVEVVNRRKIKRRG